MLLLIVTLCSGGGGDAENRWVSVYVCVCAVGRVCMCLEGATVCVLSMLWWLVWRSCLWGGLAYIWSTCGTSGRWQQATGQTGGKQDMHCLWQLFQLCCNSRICSCPSGRRTFSGWSCGLSRYGGIYRYTDMQYVRMSYCKWTASGVQAVNINFSLWFLLSRLVKCRHCVLDDCPGVQEKLAVNAVTIDVSIHWCIGGSALYFMMSSTISYVFVVFRGRMIVCQAPCRQVQDLVPVGRLISSWDQPHH